MTYIAFTVKGLENISEKEILRELPGAQILKKESKAILFSFEGEIQETTKLTTVDDICFFIKEFESYNRFRNNDLAELITKIDFSRSIARLSEFRNINANQFSLTVSLPGLENLNTLSFKDLLSKELTKNNNWKYLEKDHENFDIRIFRGEKSIFVGVRITKKSLHEREYKSNYKRGSLRPTVAAALVEVATNGTTGNLVDNFCGSGTVLCEAFIKGNQIFGGDIDGSSVTITKENLKNLEFADFENIKQLDAGRTDWGTGKFDFVVSNLPWGKQVEIGSVSELFKASLNEYKRILKPDGKLVLLAKQNEMLLSFINQIFPGAKVESFSISMVGQQPWVVKVER